MGFFRTRIFESLNVLYVGRDWSENLKSLENEEFEA